MRPRPTDVDIRTLLILDDRDMPGFGGTCQCTPHARDRGLVACRLLEGAQQALRTFQKHSLRATRLRSIVWVMHWHVTPNPSMSLSSRISTGPRWWGEAAWGRPPMTATPGTLGRPEPPPARDPKVSPRRPGLLVKRAVVRQWHCGCGRYPALGRPRCPTP